MQPPPFQNRHFITVPFQDGPLFDLSDNPHPTQATGWGHQSQEPISLESNATHYGFVVEGNPLLTPATAAGGQTVTLCPGMYFCVPGEMTIAGGKGVIISRLDFQGVFSVGGPIEEQGRLRYIDGCSDSLLVHPSLKGNPCLNHLHFPTHIDQTRHTHPSIRVGIVARGRGRCVVPENDDGSGQEISIPLVPGQVFLIPTDGQHSFFTDDQTMDVIAYHPDSDTGPDHDDHPMVNRTLVDGVPAAEIDEIRTQKIP
ncbi:MAG: hypothetical protein VB857_13380 [Pirellulaceae bacterium]